MRKRRLESYAAKFWASAGGLLFFCVLFLAAALAVIEASPK